MIRCLIIDKIHKRIFEILESAGFQVDYQPKITREEIIKSIKDYEVLIVRGKTTIDRQILENGINLRIVARAGAGLDILDVDYLKENNIGIINSPEANRDAVGDQTVGMILSLLTRLPQADREVKNGKWLREENRGYELVNRVVGIIGFGNMGKALAQRLTGFGCKILVYDKYNSDFGIDYIEECTMDQIFAEADILSLHIPLTKETNALITDEFLSKFKKDLFFINTARGQISPMAPIVNALKSGKLLGVGLDVLECEDFSKFTETQRKNFDFLAHSDKTLLTPHIGGWSFESYEKISVILGTKIVKFMG